MKIASISEAKNGLSAYVEQVRNGETVVLTDRGRPVAQIVAVESSTDLDTEQLRTELERRGVIRRALLRPGEDFLKRLGPLPTARGDALDALLTERRDGR
jgi:prevent-host-death family protein